MYFAEKLGFERTVTWEIVGCYRRAWIEEEGAFELVGL
jgi:hypothetical protein